MSQTKMRLDIRQIVKDAVANGKGYSYSDLQKKIGLVSGDSSLLANMVARGELVRSKDTRASKKSSFHYFPSWFTQADMDMAHANWHHKHKLGLAATSLTEKAPEPAQEQSDAQLEDAIAKGVKALVERVPETKPVVEHGTEDTLYKQETLRSDILSPIVSIMDNAAHAIADVLAYRVVALMRDRIEAELSTAACELVDRCTKEDEERASSKKVDTPAKKKIALLGLLPGQAKMIDSEFGDVFSITNLGKDPTAARMQAVTKTHDAVVAMADFIGHSYAAVINGVARDKLHLVRGGMTAVRDALTKLYVE